MKYAKDTRPIPVSTSTAEVLMEAMPWIKEITGKTVVIKYGGNAMKDCALRDSVISDIVLMKIIGIKPIVVHGGGPDITSDFEKLGLESRFVGGQRITTEEGMEVVAKSLIGKVNQDLVSAMNQHGSMAVGVNGTDAATIIAKQKDIELGRVGSVVRINTDYLNSVLDLDFIPIVASVALGDDAGIFNVNADAVAGHLAAAIGAHKVIFLTDVDGLYDDFDDKDTLISNLTIPEAKQLAKSDKISSGMIPKIRACITALEQGVFRAHIINGTVPHAILLELLTNIGVGTTLHSSDKSYKYDTNPLGNFASKLLENARAAQAQSSFWVAEEYQD